MARRAHAEIREHEEHAGLAVQVCRTLGVDRELTDEYLEMGVAVAGADIKLCLSAGHRAPRRT